MTTELQGIHGSMRIERPAPRVVVMRISGHDIGELGDAPFKEVERALTGAADPIELFVDARDSTGVTTDVSGAWAGWLVKHRAQFAHVSMLTRSKFVQVTAEFVRRFGDLTDKMRIYTDEKSFDEALAASVTPKG
jgi:hypothetical protein